jgi:hypothetical protein
MIIEIEKKAEIFLNILNKESTNAQHRL